MSGHVFITQGDVTHLTCDAWLWPTDAFRSAGRFRARFSDAEKAAIAAFRTTPPAGWRDERVRAVRLLPSDDPENRPRCWAVNVGGTPSKPVDWFMAAVREYAQKAAADLAGVSQFARRAKPLLALHFVGVGAGMAGNKRGAIVLALVEELHLQAAALDVDFVLVAYDHQLLTAAQQARRRLVREGTIPDPFLELSASHRGLARSLAGMALDGKLALFLGAGASAGAGLPDWEGLLKRLEDVTGITRDYAADTESLPEVDRALLIEQRLRASGQSLGNLIREEFATVERSGLTHSLLASLPVDQVITTNYDQLFEQASEDAGRALDVLPSHKHRVSGRRLLVKMNGCVSRPEEIVLTREDYLRYGESRAAIVGAVQGMFLTRHLLFIGYSLGGENFHRVAFEVKKLLHIAEARADAEPNIGTALTFLPRRATADLWEPDIHCVALVPEGSAMTKEETARYLEILLDLLLAEASDGSTYFLDDTFSGVMTPPELELAERLRGFAEDVPNELKELPAWTVVARTLENLGLAPAT